MEGTPNFAAGEAKNLAISAAEWMRARLRPPWSLQFRDADALCFEKGGRILDAPIASDFKSNPLAATDLKLQRCESLRFQLRSLPSLAQIERRFWLRFRWRSAISNHSLQFP